MILRQPRRVHAAVGALILAGPVSAALADAPPSAVTQASATPTVHAHVRSHRLGYGHAVVVNGRISYANAGQTVALDYAPLGTTSWHQVASRRVTSSGRFRLSAPLRNSGQVKVTVAEASATPSAFTADTSVSSTAPEHVAVAASIRIGHRVHSVLGAGAIQVHGELLPQAAGRRVALQARRGGRWVTLASTRTRARGRFGFRYHLDFPGQAPLRVHFAGDSANAAVSKPAGQIVGLRPSTASWYEDAGNTACGFHAYYGVANLSLPCGAHVTFSRGGRTVTATVDDRGPYVGGREWDLNQNTAAALGFGGVGVVWSSA
jgi:hypothetical protein